MNPRGRCFLLPNWLQLLRYLWSLPRLPDSLKVQVDMSLFKDFHLWKEQHVLGFRADFFNIFNIASYGNPDAGVNDGSWSLISGVRSPARQIQLSLHYMF